MMVKKLLLVFVVSFMSLQLAVAANDSGSDDATLTKGAAAASGKKKPAAPVAKPAAKKEAVKK